MPANLNALIRYKQIDRCLSNPYIKSTIATLQEACSKQLAEHRGVYKLVSERTIRDDIRIMRSSALGFNAPIEVSDGCYFYSDKNYSIFNAPITEKELLLEIYASLNEINSSEVNPGIEAIIEKIELLLSLQESQLIERHVISPKEQICYKLSLDSPLDKYESPKHTLEKCLSGYYSDKSLLTWAEILNAL